MAQTGARHTCMHTRIMHAHTPMWPHPLRLQKSEEAEGNQERPKKSGGLVEESTTTSPGDQGIPFPGESVSNPRLLSMNSRN